MNRCVVLVVVVVVVGVIVVVEVVVVVVVVVVSAVCAGCVMLRRTIKQATVTINKLIDLIKHQSFNSYK